MQLIVISSPEKFNSELKVLPHLFENGLEVFHLRKPKFSFKKMDEYLRHFPKEHLNKVVIHTHHSLARKYKLKGVHLTRKQKKKKFKTWWIVNRTKWYNRDAVITCSCHKLDELCSLKYAYNYVLLSPIFDSISKYGHEAAFNHNQLVLALNTTKYKVVALGGIDESNLATVRQLGFSGAAVLGALWKGKTDVIERFKAIKNRLALDRVSLNTETNSVRQRALKTA